MLRLGCWASFFDTRLGRWALCRLWPGLLYGLLALLRLRAYLLLALLRLHRLGAYFLRTLRLHVRSALRNSLLTGVGPVWYLLRCDVVRLR
jgi:hypothetical protein